ncbi:ribonuclease HII [Prolixibacter bellariivorans]|uniref:Ribonuclease HII n=1 Tax=Prolixibacter bellariivorans TaxID=314319 RepID=A0A5M4AYL2_9BACT|nr:ribonuclease HII [Prolixibacter bellariivorans]GET32970.1 ribonuclease HII [Prolixibacter bellariivorans]
MLASFLHEGLVEAGCDEAGRGCLAGPVFAAAVILPADFRNELLNDSKQLTEKNRYLLREVIQKEAISWAVGSYDNTEIDEVNILNASIFSMHRALAQLKVKPDHILVDGNRFKPYQDIPHTCVVKGDGKYLSIAAASILAKTYRDDFMLALHQEYPFYAWKQNKGYPTKAHREAIKQYGITPYHRKSFRLTDDQLSLKF